MYKIFHSVLLTATVFHLCWQSFALAGDAHWVRIPPEQTDKASQVVILKLDDVTMYGDVIHVTGQDVTQQQQTIVETLLRGGIMPGEMTLIEPSLEDVFIACMR